MSIKYRVQQKAQPGVAGGGVKKYYASIVLDGEATIDDLVKDIEKFSSLTEPDIRGVIIALENSVQNKLAEGKIVRLEKLGSLYPAISSTGVEKAEEVTSAVIKEAYINYRPGERLMKTLNGSGFVKVS